ncbi:hypothetical protein PRZ48_010249 [Zasmidium cellare]|uniref:Secreted protein n=1 Tax=Zasmidium cellare TaxID=395010 RepID=A0ABR0E832_ZASCE|nr:hypothetical protein PRZ48_010249 [Zasmidium cellare]
MMFALKMLFWISSLAGFIVTLDRAFGPLLSNCDNRAAHPHAPICYRTDFHFYKHTCPGYAQPNSTPVLSDIDTDLPLPKKALTAGGLNSTILTSYSTTSKTNPARRSPAVQVTFLSNPSLDKNLGTYSLKDFARFWRQLGFEECQQQFGKSLETLNWQAHARLDEFAEGKSRVQSLMQGQIVHLSDLLDQATQNEVEFEQLAARVAEHKKEIKLLEARNFSRRERKRMFEIAQELEQELLELTGLIDDIQPLSIDITQDTVDIISFFSQLFLQQGTSSNLFKPLDTERQHLLPRLATVQDFTELGFSKDQDRNLKAFYRAGMDLQDQPLSERFIDRWLITIHEELPSLTRTKCYIFLRAHFRELVANFIAKGKDFSTCGPDKPTPAVNGNIKHTSYSWNTEYQDQPQPPSTPDELAEYSSIVFPVAGDSHIALLRIVPHSKSVILYDSHPDLPQGRHDKLAVRFVLM